MKVIWGKKRKNKWKKKKNRESWEKNEKMKKKIHCELLL
jgi:hypothetical protein